MLGAGHTAASVCAALGSRRPARVTIVNRTIERATALATRHRAEVATWSDRHDAVASADVAFACVSSPEAVIDAGALHRARGNRGRALVCVDLAMPRVIDSGVSSLHGVTLLDLATLEALAPGVGPAERDVVTPAAHVVEAGVERFMAWWRARSVIPTVARLHQHADAVRDAELARALGRLPLLSPRERRVVVGLARRIVSRLLHEPTASLKRDIDGANTAAVVCRLFALDGTSDRPLPLASTASRTEELSFP